MDNITHTVPTGGMGQATFEQCWYASYKMMLTFLKRNTNEIKDKLGGAGIDFDDAMKKGLLDTDYKKAADALGLKAWAGSTFNQKPGFFDIGLSDGAEAFLDALKAGPLWVSRKAGPDSYHIVVAYGYDDSDERILYNNPFPGPTDAVQARLSANIFVRSITGALGSVQGKK